MLHAQAAPEQLQLPGVTSASAETTFDRDEDPTPPVLHGYYDQQTGRFETD